MWPHTITATPTPDGTDYTPIHPPACDGTYCRVLRELSTHTTTHGDLPEGKYRVRLEPGLFRHQADHLVICRPDGTHYEPAQPQPEPLTKDLLRNMLEVGMDAIAEEHHDELCACHDPARCRMAITGAHLKRLDDGSYEDYREMLEAALPAMLDVYRRHS